MKNHGIIAVQESDLRKKGKQAEDRGSGRKVGTEGRKGLQAGGIGSMPRGCLIVFIENHPTRSSLICYT